jgi:hypothetical protein
MLPIILKLLILPVIAEFLTLLNFETADLLADNFKLKKVSVKLVIFCYYSTYMVDGKASKDTFKNY